MTMYRARVWMAWKSGDFIIFFKEIGDYVFQEFFSSLITVVDYQMELMCYGCNIKIPAACPPSFLMTHLDIKPSSESHGGLVLK